MSNWIQKKYVALVSPQLDGLVQKTDSLWNMRCSYCGDSSKSKSKKRGYLYEKKGQLVYRCHNCGVSRSFSRFLQDHDGGSGLYRQYLMETLNGRDDSSMYSVMQKKKESDMALSELAKTRTSSPKAKTTELLFSGLLDKVSSLPEDHQAVRYLKDRFVPDEALDRCYWLDDMRDVGQLSDKAREKLQDFSHKESRIVIPAWNSDGKLIGVTCRDVTGKSSLRYVAIKISNDDEPFIFGNDKYDPKMTGYVVEGPLDSFFLPNCIAVGGSDFAKVSNKISRDLTTFIFDNQPMNSEVVRNYEWFIDSGYRVFIWPEKFNWKDVKDLNDAAKYSETLRYPENMAAMVEENSYTGLTAKMRLAKWLKSK